MPVSNYKRTNFNKLILVLLLLIIVLVKVVSLNKDWVEQFYSEGLYIPIGKFYRFLFGWLPFSIGDILYTLAALFIIYWIVKTIRVIKRGSLTRRRLSIRLEKWAIFIAIVYILFNLNWGLNYNRKGIQYQLKINSAPYSRDDLTVITRELVVMVNKTKKATGNGLCPADSTIMRQSYTAYERAALAYPYLKYRQKSVKRSLYGKAGNYLGFAGYYNPFTGEAHLNLTLPRFIIPFVACHEMAHQVGYANESEANFVGYLTAIHSPNVLFHYSGYLDLFRYSNLELSLRDSVTARQNYQQLDPLVKRDLTELRNFYKSYRNPVEPFIKLFYDQYLKANQQDKGVDSYNEVVGLLIAYYKKYGKI
jgi:hypothetical protein